MESCGNGGRVVNMSSIGGFGGCTANNSGLFKNKSLYLIGRNPYSCRINWQTFQLLMAQQNMQSME